MKDLSKYTDEDIINIISSDAEAELKKRGYGYGWHKKEPYIGCIYILVNPAFPDLVKIGYADDAEKRLKTLNRNSGLPDPFHCYAIYKVKKRLEDLRLHGLIDSLDPSLRHSKNREFYEMDCDKAYKILSAIAQINGNEEQLILNPFSDSYFDQENVGPNGGETTTGETPIGPTEDISEKQIPNGTYTLKRKKKSDNKVVYATAEINNGKWTLLKGSILGINEDKGVSQKAKNTRTKMSIDVYGKLINDFYLGECTPSFAGTIVMNQSNNGWDDWHDKNGDPVDKYRKN